MIDMDPIINALSRLTDAFERAGLRPPTVLVLEDSRQLSNLRQMATRDTPLQILLSPAPPTLFGFELHLKRHG